VAFFTGKRFLRRKIIKHLRHSDGLGEEENRTIEFMNLLEEMYPNPCYSVEFNRCWTRLLNEQQIVEAAEPEGYLKALVKARIYEKRYN
jgi:hypothetical protein